MYKGWVGKYEVGMGSGFMYPPESPGPAINQISAPMGLRPQHKSITFAGTYRIYSNNLHVFSQFAQEITTRGMTRALHAYYSQLAHEQFMCICCVHDKNHIEISQSCTEKIATHEFS